MPALLILIPSLFVACALAFLGWTAWDLSKHD